MIDPETAELIREGVQRLEQGDTQNAIAAFRRWAEIAPVNHEAHIALGVSLHNAERFADAIAAFARARELKPDDVDALRGLGLTYFKMDDLARAEPALDAVLAQRPNDDAVLACLAAFAAHKGDFAAAYRHLDIRRSVLAEELPYAAEGRAGAFLHIPKTGGTSVVAAIEGLCANLGHRIVLDAAGAPYPRNYFSHWVHHTIVRDHIGVPKIFTNVRNIFAFLVSVYEDARRGYTAPQLLPDTFCARQGFDYFIRFLSDKKFDSWVNQDLIYFQLFAQPSGEMIVDWVNRTEDIAADLNAFLGAQGLPERAVGMLNRKVEEDHRSYYTSALVDLVAATWRDDIRLFGFDFEHGYGDDYLLHRDVSAMKSRIRYSLFERRLIVTP
jgi:tetratricopeptide (TPR) repeat protein